MGNKKREKLAGKIMTTLPQYNAWLSKLQFFMTPEGSLGQRLIAILWILRHKVIPEEDFLPSRLAQYLGVTPSMITRALTQLENDGLVERAMDPEDRRRVTITLTDKGRDVSVYVENHHIQSIVGGMEGLGDDQVDALLRTIDDLGTVLTALANQGAGGALALQDDEDQIHAVRTQERD